MTTAMDDLFDHARAVLGRVMILALDRAVESVRISTVSAVQRRVQSLYDGILYFTGVLGRLSHGTANLVANAYRGPSARPLTRAETKVIMWCFGTQPVLPSEVRIVAGSGFQKLAVMAFMNGNPAITIGNTIFIKPSKYRELGGSNLAATLEGVEMLLHEYTHVVQYARMGFAVFGARYAQELRAAGWDATALYAYNRRSRHFDQESIEGQATLVGDFGEQLALPPERRTPALIHQLRSKLRGTGLLGQ